ncbi:MAG: beta-ketoacyl synthase N-terminal-like domain-containing protein [Desulfobacterales bacterium]|jgi:3-oxoacyl-[acyl-carrier-protein] synthase II
MARRVVITACSAITPIGRTRAEIVRHLVEGISGVKPLRSDDLLTDHIHSGVYGTVDYPIDYDFKRSHSKTMGPVSFYACQVAKETLAASGLDPAFITSGRLGVAFGSTHGSPSVQRNIYKTFFSESKQQFASIGAVDYLKSMVHTTAVNITKMFGITGRVISSSTACTTSSQSIGFGYESVKYGMQDAMLCGGADEYDTTTVAVFDNLLACSSEFNATPHLTPRPFDVRRDGLVVGEGAGALLLEEYEHAKNRGAGILGEIIGFSCNNNGGDLILPNTQGITATIALALKDAAIVPEAVDFISAHATGTKMGDVIEAQATGSIYGKGPLVTGLKSYMGHTMGSCGAIEGIITLYMMAEGFVPPTLNLVEVDGRCAMIRHVQGLEKEPIRIGAVQNFAFGGVNTCFILKNISGR